MDTKKSEFLVFGDPHLEEEDIQEVVRALRSGWIGTGPRVLEFEKQFSEYKDTSHAIAVASCTAALQLSLMAEGLQATDEVITTSMTFGATVNAIIHAGARPVLVDVDPITFNLDPKLVANAITPNTRAILVMHLAGHPCEMETLTALADANNLLIIEDCAHAIEAEYKGQKMGTFGKYGCFSFYVTKNLVTGEGGMIIARDPEKVARIRSLALHGMSRDAWKRFSDEGYKHYQIEEAGYKYNMTDIQGALGLGQLRRIDKNWRRRREIWHRYRDALSHLPIGLPAQPGPDVKHAYHLFQVRVKKEVAGLSRDQFLAQMTLRDIGTGVHYLSIADHPYYQRQFGWAPDDYKVAKEFGRTTASIPLSSKLSDLDVDKVIEAIKDIFLSGTR